MKRKIVSVLFSPGTNCENETMEAVRQAGGDPKLVFLWDIYNRKECITDCDLLIVPGGFSFGDHLETGLSVATFLEDYFSLLVESKIPTLGICNGNQILVRAGLFGAGIAMVQNKSKVFCSRPIRHSILPSNCIWTKGLKDQSLTFPAAHGYGKFSGKVKEGNIVSVYDGASPNGGDIAMITDDSGRMAAIMDHPERPPDGEGLEIFRCGLSAV